VSASAWLPWRRARPEAQRWIVLDVESSGLDPGHDRLLAIAGVALRTAGRAPVIDLGDSFEVVLRHEAAAVDKANILVHGIGIGAQRSGVDPGRALDDFRRWVGEAPLLGFHVGFDKVLIQRALRATGRRRLANAWIDLADVARVARPDLPARSLDDWMAALGIRCAARHRAASDALATAELLLGLWPRVRAQMPRPDSRSLARLAARRRWLGA
jgi:DNA polymerase III subunit epsilon